MNSLHIYHQIKFRSIRLILAVLLFCSGFDFQSAAQTIQQNAHQKTKNFAEPLGDNAFISLLTVSPGREVYSQYGHTAIRVCDPGKKIDIAFNYGLFDFNSPNFIWRFVRGETDYMVGICSYSDFIIEYQIDNRAVTEQIINFTPAEKEAIWQALVENIQPKNRTYRYNFFFNNCATKPRDVIIKNISGKVDYRWKGKFTTLREEVHFFTDKYPWTQFGIDLVLGAPADTFASLRSQQFAPELLLESFSKAVILKNSAKSCPLVLSTNHPATIAGDLVEKHCWLPGPDLVMWIAFLIVACFSTFEFRKRKRYYMLDAVLFTTTGLVGLVIAFMVLFSEHPTTNVNYLLLWLHPAHIIYAVGLIFPAFRNKIANIYLSINLPFQIFALAGSLFLPQYFHPAFYPILLCLIVRSSLSLFILLKKRTHA
jgi:hypothetical protein